MNETTPRTGSPAIARIAPFALYIGMLVLESAVDGRTTGWDLRWLYAVKAGLVLLALLVLVRHYTELWHPPRIAAGEWLLAILVGAGVFVAWINLDQPWATIGESRGFVPLRPGTQELDLWLVIIRVTGATLIVPVMEELFWRSFLMRWIQQQDFLSLAPSRVGIRAFLITAVLFALEHNLWLAGLVAGLSYNWLYIRSGNLWTAILAHAVTNGLLAAWVLRTGQWSFW